MDTHTEVLNQTEMNNKNLDDIIKEINNLTQSINHRKILLLDETKTEKYILHQQRMIEYENKKVHHLKNLLNQTE